MPTEIRVPEFGESVVEATVGHWLKNEGDSVAVGDPLVELETEKVNSDVAADEAGVLVSIVHQEGETVHPGDVLAILEVGAEGTTAPSQSAKPSGETSAPQTEPARPAEPSASGVPETGPEAEMPPRAQEAGQPTEREQERGPISPVAQRLASELGVDLAAVRGTGPGGRVMKEDVEAVAQSRPAASGLPGTSPTAASAPKPQAAPSAVAPYASQPATPATGSSGRGEVRHRLSRRRLTIGRRLVEAQHTAAMLTTFNEIDMSAVVDLRKRKKEGFKKSTGSDLGFMSFFVKASVGALKAFPEINAELQGEELVLKQYYDIGIALGDREGLVVPVVRDADKLSFAQIEQTIADFIQKANDRSLSLEDLKGGTFTITNGGVFGSMMSTPILNPPQVAILGMHRMVDRPSVVNGEIVIRPMMYVAVSYDHRVVDGREAVLFLFRIKELIEDPERLLLEG